MDTVERMTAVQEKCKETAEVLREVMHTPGPWRIDEWGQVVHGNGNNVVVRGMALTSGKEAEANARLIAAAPETAAERDRLKEINAELLAALKFFMECHRNPHCSNGEKAWEMALSAIAKAKVGAA